MNKISNARLIKILAGIGGTFAVILVILLRGAFPLTEMISGKSMMPVTNKARWTAFFIVSGVFFFFPYLMMLGITGAENLADKAADTEGGLMSSYYAYESSKKAWVRHIVACAVGVISAYFLWELNGLQKFNYFSN